MPRSPGEQFAGYTIIKLIGRGGMGEIYLARHPHLPRNEALKVLPGELSRDPMYRQRFVREAELASSVVHPAIVTIFNSGEYDGHLWIAMEFIDGIDGLKLLRRHQRGLPVSTVIAVVSSVAAALDRAHATGLLHRDVKPANILLQDADGPEPRVLLADFGIAKSQQDVSNLTSTNMFLGTVAYAAPEQLLGDPVDGRSDQYSLAATVFEFLTGRPPFQGANSASIIAHHLNSSAPHASSARPEISPAVDDVLDRALAKSPSDRFESCRAFASALEKALASPAASSTLPPPPPHRPAPALRKPPPPPPQQAPMGGQRPGGPPPGQPPPTPGYPYPMGGPPPSGPMAAQPPSGPFSAPIPAQPERGSGVLIGLSVAAVVLLIAIVAGVIYVGKSISDAADKADTTSDRTAATTVRDGTTVVPDGNPATRTTDSSPQPITGPSEITPGECLAIATQPGSAGTVLASKVDCDSAGLNFYAGEVIASSASCSSDKSAIITFPSSNQKLCLTPNFIQSLCYQVPTNGGSLADYQEVSCSGPAGANTTLARVTRRSNASISCEPAESRWTFSRPQSIGYCLAEV
ncbi:serine/threonine-protein kinase [Gordonia sp. ABSL49_1]|uniref:serine/threonine-protein kinase n=1 Tax=Gordonia sp. ABSL49_1 TaxID=2920941 RepID=UPI001F11067C|nr:serine/threonine-protein kinase [Gordonia sp. ABSL49_1]MCH5643217.1 serine/threonine protein kinase [Gordonia sp. ABSL49_1]